MPSSFDSDPPDAVWRRRIANSRPPWFHTASAVFAGVFLAGLILLVMLRAYLHWSVNEAVEQMNKTFKEQMREYKK